ncbi:MAG: peptidoglycan bridge formation glycyltransferase FemA/FemB family protein [Candidatus Saccharimonadales bacterium]
MAILTTNECSITDYEIALKKLQPKLKVAATFLQSPLYGRWQQAAGKIVIYFVISQDSHPVGAGLAIRYDLPSRLGNFLYCPYGPLLPETSSEILESLRTFFKPIAERMGSTFVRVDNNLLGGLPRVKLASNSMTAMASLQPRAEWLLDISPSATELWAGFHKHARYNVRLAERASTKFQLYTPAEAPIETFYDLMKATAERSDFGIMNLNYYQSVFKSLNKADGFVTICTINGQPAAVALFVEYDKQLHYVYAGSSNNFRKIAPAYYLIWQAIQEAKRRGLSILNFGGITDPVKSKHLGGVTDFKRRFGGYEAIHKNPIDLIYQPFKYKALAVYKALRHR